MVDIESNFCSFSEIGCGQSYSLNRCNISGMQL